MQVYFPGQCRALVMAVMNLRFLIPQSSVLLITPAQTAVDGSSLHIISHTFFLIQDDIGI